MADATSKGFGLAMFELLLLHEIKTTAVRIIIESKRILIFNVLNGGEHCLTNHAGDAALEYGDTQSGDGQYRHDDIYYDGGYKENHDSDKCCRNDEVVLMSASLHLKLSRDKLTY